MTGAPTRLAGIPSHSTRSETIGSNRLAWRAGRYVAAAATTSIVIATSVTVVAS
jgi:hypothetical protein